MKYPDATEEQIGKIKLCQRISKENPDISVTSFWCHIPEDKEFTTAFGQEAIAYWSVFAPDQNGYKEADVKLPAYFAEDIKELLKEPSDDQEELRLYKILKELETI